MKSQLVISYLSESSRGMKLKAVIFLLISMAANVLFANDQLIQKFDQGQYSPAKYGLKDLTFEVRIANLEKELKQRFALDKVNDLHFKVYWVMPGKFLIEVEGLPNGFEALRNELKKLIVERIEYVIPQDMSNRLRGYEFAVEKIGKNDSLLKGKDRTQSNPISEIHLTFSHDTSLKSMKTYSPSGSQTAKFDSAIKPWSHNKRVVEKVQVDSVMGIQKTKIETDIEYLTVDGFGLPSKIETKTTITAMTNKENEKTQVSSIMKFDSYKVNSGAAQRKILANDAN